MPTPWWVPLPLSPALVPSAGLEDIDPGGPLLPAAAADGTIHYRDAHFGVDARLTPRRFGSLTYDEDVPVPIALIEQIIDMEIGFVPIVGEVVAVAEVICAWQTGTDHWGRPVTDLQLWIITLFALVPFISGTFLGSLAGQVGHLPHPAAPTGPLVDDLFSIARTGLGLDDSAVAGLGTIKSVKGPNATAQLIKDLARRMWWDGFIPPRGVSALRAPANPAAAGWVPLGDVQFVVFDDVYMANVFSEAVARAVAVRGNTVNLLTDLPVSSSTAAFYVRMLGKETIHVTSDLQEVFLDALHARGVLELEDDIESEMARVDALNIGIDAMETRVLFSSNLRLELQNFFLGMR